MKHYDFQSTWADVKDMTRDEAAEILRRTAESHEGVNQARAYMARAAQIAIDAMSVVEMLAGGPLKLEKAVVEAHYPTGVSRYHVVCVIHGIYYLKETTILGEPLRYNSKEDRLEAVTNPEFGWDVYVNDEEAEFCVVGGDD